MFNKSQRIAELEERLQEANTKLMELQSVAESYEKTISSFPGVKQEYDEQVKKLSEKHEKEVKQLKHLLEETETSVNRRVTESLQTIGVNAFAPEEIISTPSTSPKDIYQKFLSLKGPEQTEFYRKHEKEISLFQNAKQ